MSTLDFKREVAEALASNPFLEEQEEGGTGQDSASDADSAKLDTEGSHEAYAHAGDVHESGLDAAATNAIDEADSHDDAPEIQRIASAPIESPAYSGDYPATRQTSERNTDVGQWARAETSLQDALYANLCGFSLSERDKCLAFFIIEAIDDDGYLREPLTEL